MLFVEYRNVLLEHCPPDRGGFAPCMIGKERAGKHLLTGTTNCCIYLHASCKCLRIS